MAYLPAMPPRSLTIAVIGNPNTGKSTLFKALTGMHSRIGNYPGVTVEKKIGRFTEAGRTVHLIDLPGTYSLSPRCLDEMVSVDVLLGRQPDVGPLDAVSASSTRRTSNGICTSSARCWTWACRRCSCSTCGTWPQRRGLRSMSPTRAGGCGFPVIAVRSPSPAAASTRFASRCSPLSQRSARRSRPRVFPPAFYAECEQLSERLRELGEHDLPQPIWSNDCCSTTGGRSKRSPGRRHPQRIRRAADGTAANGCTHAGCRVPAIEAKSRYAWVAADARRASSRRRPTRTVTASDRLDRFLTHKFWGLAVFAVMMFLIFQAIFTLGRAADGL